MPNLIRLYKRFGIIYKVAACHYFDIVVAINEPIFYFISYAFTFCEYQRLTCQTWYNIFFSQVGQSFTITPHFSFALNAQIHIYLYRQALFKRPTSTVPVFNFHSLISSAIPSQTSNTLDFLF